MTEEFEELVEAAAAAGWWTVLIGAIWLTLVWLLWRSILKSKPAWLLKLWGFELDWKDMQRIMIHFMVVAKMILFVCILLCIWLSLWAC